MPGQRWYKERDTAVSHNDSESSFTLTNNSPPATIAFLIETQLEKTRDSRLEYMAMQQ